MQTVRRHPYAVLILLSAFLFLLGNSLVPVTDTAEANYALTSKEMVLSGDWLSPQIYGRYWYDKPIFYYWMLSASFSVFGFNEFAARFPSAVFGTLSVLFTFWFAQKVYDEKTAWGAALILSTSLEFFLLSKAVITDAALFLSCPPRWRFSILATRKTGDGTGAAGLPPRSRSSRKAPSASRFPASRAFFSSC